MKLNLLAGEAGLVCMELAEDLTLFELQTPDDVFARLLGATAYARRVLLNLEKATYIDSAGVGWLVIAHKNFLEGGGKLVLHSLSPMAHHVFRVLGLHGVLNVARDETTALALAGGPALLPVGTLATDERLPAQAP